MRTRPFQGLSFVSVVKVSRCNFVSSFKTAHGLTIPDSVPTQSRLQNLSMSDLVDKYLAVYKYPSRNVSIALLSVALRYEFPSCPVDVVIGWFE
jgi:hypothetical protein